MTFQKFKSKPKTVEAFQWFEGSGVNPENAVKHDLIDLGTAAFAVTTIHGQKTVVRDGDWIVKEPEEGKYYPVKDEIFKQSYE